MLSNLINWKPLLPAFAGLLLLFIMFSCGPEEQYEGTYKAQAGDSQKYSECRIELSEKGLGVWRLRDDEVSFRWDVKDSEIWLSTKSGGIIIGKIYGDTIEITLPGTKTLPFKKIK